MKKKRILLIIGIAVLLGVGWFSIEVYKIIRTFGIEGAIHHECMPIVIAVWKYEDEHQKLPDDLSTLVPEFIDEIPEHRFINKIDYERVGEGWELKIYSDATGASRVYTAKGPDGFTKEEIKESVIYYHFMWLVNES